MKITVMKTNEMEYTYFISFSGFLDSRIVNGNMEYTTNYEIDSFEKIKICQIEIQNQYKWLSQPIVNNFILLKKKQVDK